MSTQATVFTNPAPAGERQRLSKAPGLHRMALDLVDDGVTVADLTNADGSPTWAFMRAANAQWDAYVSADPDRHPQALRFGAVPEAILATLPLHGALMALCEAQKPDEATDAAATLNAARDAWTAYFQLA